jgi:hypothetical protein
MFLHFCVGNSLLLYNKLTNWAIATAFASCSGLCQIVWKTLPTAIFVAMIGRE